MREKCGGSNERKENEKLGRKHSSEEKTKREGKKRREMERNRK